MSESKSESKKDWVYRDSTKKMLMRGLLIACAISVLLELFVLDKRREYAHFGVDRLFGFYAGLGFISCSIMIFLAKGLSYILKVPTNYYDRADSESDDEKGGDA